MNIEGIFSLAPDLPGMGGISGKGIDLSRFVDHCSDLVERQEGNINIAAFSFGGMTATGLADKYAHRIDRLVYVDAFVPDDGESFTHIAGKKITRQIEAYCHVMGDEEMIPPFFETDGRYRNHPLNTLYTKVPCSREKLESLDPLYIECTAKNPLWTFTPLLEKTAAKIRGRGWKHREIASDHMPMFSHGEELFEILTG